MRSAPSRFTAVVLAGDRGPEDPLIQAAGVACKALVPVGGQPMIRRVVAALRGAVSIDGIRICGPTREQVEASPDLASLVAEPGISWAPPGETPCLSAAAALEDLPAETPVLVTTADHALLTSELVDGFLARAASVRADAVAGIARHARVAEAFPEVRRTALRFRGGAVCGCNLFALRTPAARRAVAFWRRVEQERKHPVRIARLLGPGVLLRYLAHLLTLEAALAHVGRRAGLLATAIELSPEAGVDVDSVADWRAVEARLRPRTG